MSAARTRSGKPRAPKARAARAFERYAFVAVTTKSLARARRFWVEGLGCRVTQEARGEFLMVDAGGLRLCLDVEDGDTHRAGGSDPVIGLRVASVPRTLRRLAARGLRSLEDPVQGLRGAYVRLRDPDGRIVILTEAD